MWPPQVQVPPQQQKTTEGSSAVWQTSGSPLRFLNKNQSVINFSVSLPPYSIDTDIHAVLRDLATGMEFCTRGGSIMHVTKAKFVKVHRSVEGFLCPAN